MPDLLICMVNYQALHHSVFGMRPATHLVTISATCFVTEKAPSSATVSLLAVLALEQLRKSEGTKLTDSIIVTICLDLGIARIAH